MSVENRYLSFFVHQRILMNHHHNTNRSQTSLLLTKYLCRESLFPTQCTPEGFELALELAARVRTFITRQRTCVCNVPRGMSIQRHTSWGDVVMKATCIVVLTEVCDLTKNPGLLCYQACDTRSYLLTGVQLCLQACQKMMLTIQVELHASVLSGNAE